MAELTMNKNSKYRQMLLETKNLVGYKGKESQIRCMSSYEIKAIKFIQNLVKAGRVKKWNSEETVFEYSGLPWDDLDKTHRYFMDFTIELTNGNVVFVEVKPSSQHKQAPKKPKKLTPKSESNYQQQIKAWITNQNKWNTVREWCKHQNKKIGRIKYKFVIWDEFTLQIK